MEVDEGGASQEEESDEEEALPFKVEQDKTLSAAISLAAWCPTMDLLAMVTGDSQVFVWRLGGQLLGKQQIPPSEVPITALCWHPSGKSLVVGREDGRMVMHNVEDGGQLLITSKLHDSAITSLHWVDCDTTDLSYENRAKRLFPPLAPLPASIGAFMSDHNVSQPNSAPEPTGLSVLVSGDEQGEACLSAHGTFLIGRVQFKPQDLRVADGEPPLGADVKLRIASLCMDKELRHLAVGLAVDRAGENARSPPLALVTVETPLLAAARGELYALMQHCHAVTQLLDHARGSLALVGQHWEDGFGGLFDSKATRLLELLRVKDPGAGGLNFLTGQMETESDKKARDERLWGLARRDLVNLFSCGTMSDVLRQFLIRDMNPSAAKKLQRTLGTTIAEVIAVLEERVSGSVQLLCFHLSELRGLARWTDRYTRLGLSEEGVSSLITECQDLLQRVGDFRRAVDEAAVTFGAFIRWILGHAMKVMPQSAGDAAGDQAAIEHEAKHPISGVDTRRIALFIRQDLGPSRLLQHLGTSTPDESSPETVMGTLQSLASSIEKVFRGPSEQITSAFEIPSEGRLALPRTEPRPFGIPPPPLAISQDQSPSDATSSAACADSVEGLDEIGLPVVRTPVDGSTRFVCAFVDNTRGVSGDVEAQIWVVRSKCGGPDGQVCSFESACVGLKEGELVLDLAFYSAGKLAVLLADEIGRIHEGVIGCGVPDEEEGVRSSLLMLSYEDLNFTQLPPEVNMPGVAPPWLTGFSDFNATTLEDALENRRNVATMMRNGQRGGRAVAMGGARGLGCVITGKFGVVMLDMEDEEEEGEEDDGNEGLANGGATRTVTTATTTREMQLEDDDDEASEQDAAKAEVQENFIRGMLTNHSQMPLQQIHNMLTMFMVEEPAYDHSEAELRVFLDRLVSEDILDFQAGTYSLRSS